MCSADAELAQVEVIITSTDLPNLLGYVKGQIRPELLPFDHLAL